MTDHPGQSGGLPLTLCPACRRGDHENCYDPHHWGAGNWPDPPCACRGDCVAPPGNLNITAQKFQEALDA